MSFQCRPGFSAEVLRFGFLDTDSKPYHWKEKDQDVGYFMDVFVELSRRTGLKFALRPLPLQRVLVELERGLIDGCLGYYRTPEREKFAYFLDVPLSTMELKIFVPRDRVFRFQGVDDLRGKTVSILRAQYVSGSFDESAKKGLIKTQYSDSYDMMIDQLDYGRVDCIIGVAPVLEYNIRKRGLSGRFVVLPTPVSTNNTWILIARNSSTAEKTRAREKMNLALRQMAADGSFEKIAQKYGYEKLMNHQ